MMTNNIFKNSNTGKKVKKIEDLVYATHYINNNTITQSGCLDLDKFVTQNNNVIKQLCGIQLVMH